MTPRSFASVPEQVGVRDGLVKTWVRQLRVHQWTKNFLLFLPLLGAHQFKNLELVLRGLNAFGSFCLVASAVYVLNDLTDISHDREHPSKRYRPLAAGHIGIQNARIATVLLLFAGLLLGSRLGEGFFVWLMFYLAVTTAYSFWLKRLVLVDTVVLAGLYTTRIVAGGSATESRVSTWLLGFSMLFFLSLALAKRYVELVHVSRTSPSGPVGRGYVSSDAAAILALGVASGMAAVVVYTLYLSSADVMQMYVHPRWLWFSMPIMLFWVCRIWLCAQRGTLNDDPVLFTLKDRLSRLSGVSLVAVFVLASLRIFT